MTLNYVFSVAYLCLRILRQHFFPQKRYNVLGFTSSYVRLKCKCMCKWMTMHEHKQALAWQALSHAKGHYLAAVSSNRSIAGWETDPGSVPSLRGCTIWQLRRICVCACVHARTGMQMNVCQRNWCIRPPLR